MEEIERTINNVKEYFMSFDKRFNSLATTVRSEAERHYEYESISSVNTDEYSESSSSYTDSDQDLQFSDKKIKKATKIAKNRLSKH